MTTELLTLPSLRPLEILSTRLSDLAVEGICCVGTSRTADPPLRKTKIHAEPGEDGGGARDDSTWAVCGSPKGGTNPIEKSSLKRVLGNCYQRSLAP
jgi:hypothetical protein